MRIIFQKLYNELKIDVEDSKKFKLLVSLNQKITDYKKGNIYNLILKILRKLLIFLIRN